MEKKYDLDGPNPHYIIPHNELNPYFQPNPMFQKSE